MQNISVPDPVLWFEGMPLLPHHFQQEFLYHQTIAHIQLQVCGGFNYGILELEIDNLSLLRNIFKINKIFYIMPDCVIVKIDNHPHYNLEYTLPKPDEFEKNNLTLYLTIPKLISNNYFVGKYPRYRKEQYFDIADIHSGADQIEMTKMLPNIELHSDLDLNANYTILKIAVLNVDKNLWSLNSYLPAVIKVTPTHPLYTLCSDICFNIRRKIQHLSELVYSKTANTHVNLISENLLYAQGLGAGLPLLEGLLLSGQAQPFQLYCALCSILGGLGLLTEKLAPPPPSIYQHEELLLTFEKLRLQIDSIVNSAINEKILQISCTKENDIYTIDVIKEYKINKSFMLGFKKQPTCEESHFLSWIKNAIICDLKKTEMTLQNRTLGYQRYVLERTEDILPTKGVYLVQVTIEETKEELTKLAIFNSDSLANAPEDIFIFIKKSNMGPVV